MGLFDIFTEEFTTKIRLILYAILIFFSFFIFIGASVMKGDECPLYLTISGSGFDFGPESNCNYPVAIAIIFQLLYTIFRVATTLLLLLGKLPKDMVLFQDMPQFIYVVVDLLAFFLTFIGACILSAGMNETCSTLEDLKRDCEDLEDYQNFPSGAYSASKAAQAGAWISVFVWLASGLMGFIFMWRSGRIPFLGGGQPAAAAGGTSPAPEPSGPTMETPPNNPDEIKY